MWTARRQRYTSTVAGWTVVGYVVGLGDRHTDNLLLGYDEWDLCHVDFDCLFGKGATLPVPEVVPAR